MLTNFKLLETLAVESREEFEQIVDEMRKAAANDDDNNSDSAAVDPNKSTAPKSPQIT